MGPSSRFAQIRIGSTSPPRRIPLTEWPFRLRMIEARIGYPEHIAQHRELTGTRAPGLASGRPAQCVSNPYVASADDGPPGPRYGHRRVY